MSTASQTISSQLNPTVSSYEMNASFCTLYIVRFMFWFSIFLITLSLLSSMLSNSAVSKLERELEYDTLTYKSPMMLKSHMMLNKKQRQKCLPRMRYTNDGNIENFENLEYISYSNSNTFNVQSVPLTSPLKEKTNEYSNLTFGQAIRHTISDNKQQKIVYNITANLYVIDGNVYDQAMDNLPQSYKVHLLNGNTNIVLGEMKKDGDGIYKLQVQSSDFSLLNFKHIKIVYYKGEESQVMLEGKFK